MHFLTLNSVKSVCAGSMESVWAYWKIIYLRNIPAIFAKILQVQKFKLTDPCYICSKSASLSVSISVSLKNEFFPLPVSVTVGRFQFNLCKCSWVNIGELQKDRNGKESFHCDDRLSYICCDKDCTV